MRSDRKNGQSYLIIEDNDELPLVEEEVIHEAIRVGATKDSYDDDDDLCVFFYVLFQGGLVIWVGEEGELRARIRVLNKAHSG